MGVTGLWTVVAPTARPTKLETLNRKRLAVDASIWIYQFLKAVRDKEGNALRNSHVVGFFRRICKLLYFGIKPVFVFDGGAPVLKRETIRKRARRREGRRDDAARTAGKLLAVQVARAAEDEAKRTRETRERPVEEEELPADQELVYVDEIGMDKQARMVGRGFKKTDQYHLPELDVSIAEMGAPNDPRVMSQAELEEYARQFHSGEDINLYDFSKIDFDSPFFVSLPAGDKYNILNAARLRSRLRMGYSKDQLDGMFPDRMAFSRFQIERVKERNELTQRLMHVSGMEEGEWDKGARIAGERGKEYVLIRHDGVEGGWALGVVSNKEGSKDNAIDLDEEEIDGDNVPSEEEEEFEDVAIEGVNRLPQSWKRKRPQLREVDYDISYEEAAERIAKKRTAVYGARKQAAEIATRPITASPSEASAALQQKTNVAAGANDDRIFVDQGGAADSDEEVFEDVTMARIANVDDDDLHKAIAMSLEKPDGEGGFLADNAGLAAGPVDTEADDFDLQAALAESRESKHQPTTNVRARSPKPSNKPGFGGPLPFESLNLGQSLLGKKKAKKVDEELSGGFDREAGNDAFRKPKKAQPMPDWFKEVPSTEILKPNDLEQGYASDDHVTFGREDVDRRAALQQEPAREVIDLDDGDEAADQAPPLPLSNVYEGEMDDWEMDEGEELAKRQEAADKAALEAAEVEEARRKALEEERETRYELARQIAAENEPQRMNEVAEEMQAVPPPPSKVPHFVPETEAPPIQDAKSETSELIDWSDSDHEGSAKPSDDELPTTDKPSGGRMPEAQAKKGPVAEQDDEEDVFEDINVTTSPAAPVFRQPTPPSLTKEASAFDQNMFLDDEEEQTYQQDELAQGQPQDGGQAEPDFIAEDSDEELMLALAKEAEEHARFANELNNRPKSPSEAMRDYENELKQLRNQQKKDRRDADEVTQTMIQECQALLRLFGLPYITAPMEAEAQCAELVRLGLVDGIVTDDSDIFLFGGTRIYKNMFNAAKFVECYLLSDLEKEYALDRRKLIRFAHLLGSDYTEGIPGIGPVTALEIITEFDDLAIFKDWTQKIQLGSQQPSALENLLTTAFRRKFKRTVQRKIFLSTTFPDLRVDQAYLEPEVDSNPEEFQWGVPDLDKLRSFLMATIGWSQERTDEILVPVIRDMNQREAEGVQSNITRYFTGGVGVGAVSGRGINGYNGPGEDGVEGSAPRNRTGKESGRMKNAYTRLKGEAEKRKRAARYDAAADALDDESSHTDAQVTDKPSAARRDGHKGGGTNTSISTADDDDEANTDDDEDYGSDSAQPPKKQRMQRPMAKMKRPRKTKAKA